MPTYPNNLCTLLFELPFYLLICLFTQLPTYIPTYLPMHPPSYLPLCLPTYLHFLHNQIPRINYLLTSPTPPNPTYQFIKFGLVHGDEHRSPYVILQTIYNGNNVIIAAILVYLMHILRKLVYLIYLWNGHYNTSFHVIIISMLLLD